MRHFEQKLRVFQYVSVRHKVTGSSKAWIKRHVHDPYVKLAEKENSRSRAAFKLQELQDKYKIIRSNDFVIDLGAAPGGWSLMVSKMLDFSRQGLLVSVDLLKMEPVSSTAEGNRGTHFIMGDFMSPAVRDKIAQITLAGTEGQRKANVVLSDMLQNTTGHGNMDHLKSMHICSEVLDFTKEYLQPGGHLVCKYFQGSGDKELLHEAKSQFQHTKLVKPKSSRPESREMYLLAMNKLAAPVE